MTTDELRAKFEEWADMNSFGSKWRESMFAAYEAAYASRDAEVEALRKQLCTMESERDIAKVAYASSEARAEALKRDADAFKNFHRLLCQRFDYVHDEKDWRRDQLSLIEHIVKSKYTSNGELQYLVDGLGWVVRCQDFWKYLQVRAEELKIIDAAMAKESKS